MKKLITFLTLLMPLFFFGQINYSEGWDTNNLTGWTQSGATFAISSIEPCSGTRSIRNNLFGASTNSGVVAQTAAINTSNEGVVTFSVDYKWVIYNTTPQAAAPAAELNMVWEWSNSASGPWFSFLTVDGSNHTPSATCATVTGSFVPYAGSVFLRVRANNTNTAANNYLYLDNLTLTQTATPTCRMPQGLNVTNNTSTGFRINWEAPVGTAPTNYSWEVRSSGMPGSGAAGLAASGTATGLFANATGLTAETTYSVYVKANCSATDSSFWIGPLQAATLCAAPNFTVPSTRSVCGPQPVTMNVTQANAAATTYWFDETGARVADSVNTYTTPVITESTYYNITSGIINYNDTLQLGTGTLGGSGQSPFAATKARKVQYVYSAAELNGLGFTKGLIKAIGFNVSTLGTAERNNFIIHMGATAIDNFANTTFIPTTSLQVVKAASSQTLTAGVNMFQLDTGYQWDGVSNIIVQFTYSDLDLTSNPTATQVRYGSTSPRNTSLYGGNATGDLTAMYDLATGTRSTSRPNTYFDVLDGCTGNLKKVLINYNEPPELILSSYNVNYCSSYDPPVIFVATGGVSYMNYEWTPATGVTGDLLNGWTFDPAVTTTYTLRATNNATNQCVNIQQVVIEVNQSPELSYINEVYNLCFDQIQAITAFNSVNDTTIKYGFNGNTDGVTLVNAVVGDAISTTSTVASEGSGSLNIKNGAQTNAGVVFDATFNVFNLQSAVLEFDHIAALQATATTVNDYAYLEYSTNNGASWATFKNADYTGSASATLPAPLGAPSFVGKFFTKTSYADWTNIGETDVPTNAMWKSEKFVVPASAFTATGTLKIRMRIGSDGNTTFPGWFVDNVRITPVNKTNVVWTPASNLYVDAAATIPYDGVLNVGTVYVKANTNIDALVYTVQATNIKGCVVTDTFTLNAGSNETPVVADIITCGNVPVANTGFTHNVDGELLYYTTATGGTPITTLSTSGTYYVEQVVFGCRSARVPFNVIINTQPSIPTTNATQTFCSTATVNDLYYYPVAGLQIKWFDAAVAGNELAASTTLVNGTYYGEFNNGACSSTRVAVNVMVSQALPALNVADVHFCGTTSLNDLQVNPALGATVNWYDSSIATQTLSGNTNVTTGVYYVSQSMNGCESPRTAVNVTAIQALSQPNAAAQVFCGAATVADLTATGTTGATIHWYSNATSQVPLLAGTSLNNGTYYVAQSIGDCISTKRPVNVKVVSLVAPVLDALFVCGDATVASLPLNALTGSSYNVYASVVSPTPMAQNAPIVSGTYYISKIELGCETMRTAVQVTVTPRPTSPTGLLVQNFSDTGSVGEFVMDQTNVIWFESYNNALNNTSPLPANHPLIDGQVYYGIIVGPNGCASLPTGVTVNITLGTKDLDLASLKYYPNPTDSELNISYKEAIKTVEVFDILGKQVKAEKFDATDVRLNVSSLAAGTYMIKVVTENGSQFVKIVKR